MIDRLALRLGGVGIATALIAATSPSLAQTRPNAPQNASSSAPGEDGPRSLVPPKLASHVDLPYPEGAHGRAEVLLELVVDRSGSVSQVVLVRGDAPFASAAEMAAATWHFEPATDEGRPVTARIHFLVTFADPHDANEALSLSENDDGVPRCPAGATCEPHATNGAQESTTPSAAAPATGPVSITVVGQRTDRGSALTKTDIRQLPGAFGDPFRAIEALPGVTPLASGVPYFYVRGAPPGNVGYFFDGVEVPVLFHAAAGPAVIAPWFVDDVTLYPGGYPSRYGRFAGGIVAADAVEPTGAYRGLANVRIFDASAMVEAPFANGRGNVMLGGRYSYSAAIFSLVSPDFDLSYWDYQARAQYRITDDDRVSVLAFGAFDDAAQKDNGTTTPLYEARFHRIDARYDRRLSATRRLRLAATFGDDRTLADDRSAGDETLIVRAHTESARLEYFDRMSDDVELRAGADVRLETSRLELPQGGSNGDIPTFPDHDDAMFGARADVVLDLGPFVRVVPGARFDVYHADGETVPAFEPRVSARFRVSNAVTLLHDFGIAHQLPSYIVPVSGFRPELGSGLQQSLQMSSGVETKLPGNITGTVTLFQNVLLNGTDRLAITGLHASDAALDLDARSLGHTFGAELLLKRDLTERLGGFVAYTLSRSTRSIAWAEGPAAVDRTHVLNFALGYDLGRHWRAGLRTFFYTGIPAKVAYLAAAHHPPRTAPFYRVDWRLEKRWPFEGARYISLVFEFFNTTLNREAIQASCSAYECKSDLVGPVSIPSVGVEAAF